MLFPGLNTLPSNVSPNQGEFTHLQFHVLSLPRALLVKGNGLAEESGVLRNVYSKELIPLRFIIVSGIRILKTIRQYENKINYKTGQVSHSVFRILCNLFFLTPKSQIILFLPHPTQIPIHLKKVAFKKVGVFVVVGMKWDISFPSLQFTYPYILSAYIRPHHIYVPLLHMTLHTHTGSPAEAI